MVLKRTYARYDLVRVGNDADDSIFPSSRATVASAANPKKNSRDGSILPSDDEIPQKPYQPILEQRVFVHQYSQSPDVRH